MVNKDLKCSFADGLLEVGKNQAGALSPHEPGGTSAHITLARIVWRD